MNRQHPVIVVPAEDLPTDEQLDRVHRELALVCDTKRAVPTYQALVASEQGRVGYARVKRMTERYGK